MNDLSQLWAGPKREQFTDSRGDMSPRTVEICDSFLASLYLLLTVRQLFTAAPGHVARLAAAEARNGASTQGEGLLQSLARARAALDVNPYLSAWIISGVRQELSSHHDWARLFTDIEPAFLTLPRAQETPAEKGPSPQEGDGHSEPGPARRAHRRPDRRRPAKQIATATHIPGSHQANGLSNPR